MAQETYKFEIVAEIQKATAAVDKFASGAQKQLDSIKFNTTISAISAGFDLATKAARPFVEFLKESVGEAIEAEAGLKKLSNSMRLVGDFSADAVNEFKDFADELARTTTLTDDQVISAAALAKTFTLTNKEAQKVISAAADLSAVTGDDLNSSVQKLSKSYNGFIDKSIKQLIPELKTLTDAQLQSGAAVDIVAAKFNGSARDLNDSFGGALSSVSKSILEFKEAIGTIIITNPTFIAGIRAAADSINFLTANLDKLITASKIVANISLGNTAALARGAAQAIVGKNPEAEISRIEKIRLESSARIREQSIIDNRKITKQREESLEAYNKISAELENAGLTEIEKINKSFADKIKVIRTNIDLGNSTNVVRDEKFITNLKLDNIKKVQEAQAKQIEESKRLREQAEARVKEIAANPVKALAQGEVKSGSDQSAAAAGFVAQILKGAEGAKKLVVEAGAQAAFALTGIPPEITGPILEALSAGPEKVREMVREFTKALPEIIKNIVLAIPVFIEEFAKAVPEIISALIDAVPEIAEALAKSMPGVAAALALQSPKIAIAFIQGLVQNIPKLIDGFAKEFLKIPEQFLKELLKNIPGGSALGGGGGKSGGFSLTGGLDKKVLGIDVPFLAEGGRVPNISQFKGDKFPARLDAGEQVFSGDLSSRLENFLNGNGQGQAQNVTVVLQVGQQELSRVLLDLNRGGFRTA